MYRDEDDELRLVPDYHSPYFEKRIRLRYAPRPPIRFCVENMYTRVPYYVDQYRGTFSFGYVCISEGESRSSKHHLSEILPIQLIEVKL